MSSKIRIYKEILYVSLTDTKHRKRGDIVKCIYFNGTLKIGGNIGYVFGPREELAEVPLEKFRGEVREANKIECMMYQHGVFKTNKL